MQKKLKIELSEKMKKRSKIGINNENVEICKGSGNIDGNVQL